MRLRYGKCRIRLTHVIADILITCLPSADDGAAWRR